MLVTLRAQRVKPGVGGGGELPYKTDGGSRQKIKITPLKETNVGVAQA